MLIERGKDGKEKQSHGLYSPRGRKESDLAELLSRHFTSIHFSNPWASLVAQMVKNPPAIQETWVQFLGQEDPLEK